MLKILIPMGGEAKQFSESGYTFPKPLLEIAGRSMIEVVVENIRPAEPCQFVFVCNRAHLERYALGDVLRLIAPGSIVVSMRAPTAGALCSVLLAAEHLGRDEELMVANGDQYVRASMDDFLARARGEKADCCIMTFPSAHPKWSYAKVDGKGDVVAVAEKRPISRDATVGIYYFRRAGDFLDGAHRMIKKRVTLQGQYYVCPVFNELILAHKRIITYPIERDQMFSLGTPEDYENFTRSGAAALLNRK